MREHVIKAFTHWRRLLFVNGTREVAEAGMDADGLSPPIHPGEGAVARHVPAREETLQSVIVSSAVAFSLAISVRIVRDSAPAEWILNDVPAEFFSEGTRNVLPFHQPPGGRAYYEVTFRNTSFAPLSVRAAALVLEP